MAKGQIKDEDYLNYIRQLPCIICGYKPKKTWRWTLHRHSEWGEPDRTGYYEGAVAAHHVKTPGHSRRYTDYSALPACDTYCDPSALNCHLMTVHNKVKKYDKYLLTFIDKYKEDYDTRKL